MTLEGDNTAPGTASSTTTSTQPRIGFLDLSPELRNEIYYLALVKRRDIHIRRAGSPRRKWAGYITNTFGHSMEGTRILYSPGPLDINVAILRVSRQVHSEANPILYGSNTFAMDCADMFVCLPQSTKPMLRQIKITGDWTSCFAKIMTRLRAITPVPKLSKLEFVVESLNDARDAAQEVAKLMPTLIPRLKALKQVQGLATDSVASLVGIGFGDDCPWSYHGYNHTETMRVWNAEIQKQTKELLA